MLSTSTSARYPSGWGRIFDRSDRGLLRSLMPRGSEWMLLGPLLLFVLLRIPSWFEPHWYTDEGGYAVTAWLSTHGLTLYQQVWNNKPPLLFWVYSLSLAVTGPSEFGLHIMSTIAGLVTLLAIWKIALDGWSRWRALMALLIAVLLLGTPIINGELALPENLLIAPTALAMLVVIMTQRSGAQGSTVFGGILAGALFGSAMLLQQTAVAGFIAALLWLLFLPAGGGRRLLVWMTCTAIVLGLAAIAPYVLLAGFHNVFFLLVLSYVGYARSSLPFNWVDLGIRIGELAALLVGAFLGRSRSPRQLLWLWASASLIMATAANRPYIFFTVPTVPPLAILVCGTAIPKLRSGLWPRLRSQLRPALRTLPLVLATIVPLLSWTTLLVVTDHGSLTTGSLYTVGMTRTYYQTFLGYLDGTISPVAYANSFDPRVVSEDRSVAWLHSHHLQGSTAVVWSYDAWAYVLGDLHPMLPTPAVYVDVLWLGLQTTLNMVDQGQPQVIIVSRGAAREWPQIYTLLRHNAYVRTYVYGYDQIWVAHKVAQNLNLLSSARRPAAGPAN